MSRSEQRGGCFVGRSRRRERQAFGFGAGLTEPLLTKEEDVMGMRGTWDKLKGTFKERLGRLSGDRKTVAEGRAERAEGEIKESVHDMRGAAVQTREKVEHR